jgi:DNA processing protein
MEQKAILYSLDEKITQKQLKELKNFKLDKEQSQKLQDYCSKNNIKSSFKFNFKKTKSPPYLIYYIWDEKILENKIGIWVVWPRKINKFIENYLEKFFDFIKDFKQEIIIISGLAYWTDELAHNLAIKNNIKTIAVLWFWLAKWLASKSRHLIKQIIENNWLVISEFKLKQEWTYWTFPQRNRIIAWLSDFLFVPQWGEKSWTLITINYAIEKQIPVYSCFSKCDDINGEGTNKLISQNKIIWIYNFEKFKEEIQKKYFKTQKTKKIKKENLNLSQEEKIILKQIEKWNNTVDLIITNSNLETFIVFSLLSNLELKWIIYENWWKYFIK